MKSFKYLMQKDENKQIYKMIKQINIPVIIMSLGPAFYGPSSEFS